MLKITGDPPSCECISECATFSCDARPPNGTQSDCLQSNSCQTETGCLCNGDGIRGSQHPALACLITVFVRMHNIIACKLARRRCDWDDERLYQETRLYIITISPQLIDNLNFVLTTLFLYCNSNFFNHLCTF